MSKSTDNPSIQTDHGPDGLTYGERTYCAESDPADWPDTDDLCGGPEHTLKIILGVC